MVDTPSGYPELHAFFQDQAALNITRRTQLTIAVEEAMNSTMTQHWPDSPLAREIRQCVELQKFCPKSLRGNPIAIEALTEALNDPQIRPIVEMVWDQVKRARSSDGIAMTG